jgi:exosome complex exonuclease RRP6
MLYYARSDTHYLLYIFDGVRNELVEASDRSEPEKDYISQALERSRELSLSRQETPGYNKITGEGSRGWYNYVFKHSHLALNGEQFAVFKALWQWRDETARQEDESPNFVLGPTNVTEIARVNPPDVKALHSLLPLTAPLARARLHDIWARVQEARAQGGPSLMQFFTTLAPESTTKGRLPNFARERVTLPILDEPDISIATMPQSKLFGSMPISSRWEDLKVHSADLEGNIPFPWQRFVQNSDIVDGEQETELAGQATSEMPVATEEPMARAQPEDADEEFTLKTGRKPKSELGMEPDDETSSSGESSSESESESESASEPEPVPAADEDIPITDSNGVISIEDYEPKKTKKQRQLEHRQKAKHARQELELAKKKEAKVARSAKKEEKRRQAQEDKQKSYNAVPFDYTKAASVMHTNRGQTQQVAQREPKRVFDPYAKTGDNEIKGARKMPPVRGERSATFKK